MPNEVIVSKRFTFDSAHQLVGHKGKCANLHGHTYILEVMVKGETKCEQHGSDEGFVIDFADLKDIVKLKVLNSLDHAFLAKGDEPVIDVLKASGSKVVILGFRTTVENLAIYICRTLKNAGLPLYAVRLYETPTSWAQVMADDIRD
ncbi:6-pyruvoyltetrahydropterin/6-carboxytetrahydropterin synthase [Caldalkalibacillus uzonensis]|uniref:6-carboxy-5,6,7,8-tetrahydropterin synthase n=1 Tax=Caldalkalibacillus uzonensis TaxID=353224 RepID=A0ABU0CRN5_9BACI|nr:6-carboxytetrahydropterin synthase QueD [Caldalkalibacillus uzonensis]MDQ0339082.1 6-pyruvoyltetrahydropterin/6-carboxytetrahydropterin synthase [Caldalkalibacillus uzonensis]